MKPGFIPNNSTSFIDNATKYHFGVLTSTMHMAWMRQVCGRLKGDYRYSNKLVYNNFPWPKDITDKQKQAVEEAVELMLEVRGKYQSEGSTLADLYNPLLMPVDLQKAHEKIDKAVDKCYGKITFKNELERVKFLFELYKEYTKPLKLENEEKKTPKRVKK